MKTSLDAFQHTGRPLISIDASSPDARASLLQTHQIDWAIELICESIPINNPRDSAFCMAKDGRDE